MIDAAADTALDIIVIAVAIVAVIFAIGMLFRLIGATLIVIGEIMGGGRDDE